MVLLILRTLAYLAQSGSSLEQLAADGPLASIKPRQTVTARLALTKYLYLQPDWTMFTPLPSARHAPAGQRAGLSKLESGTSSMSKKSSFGHGSSSAVVAMTQVNLAE